MGKVDLLHRGSERLRITPWRGDPSVAQLTPTSGMVPTAKAIRRSLDALAADGYRSVLTSALTVDEQYPFLEVGFGVHERLHLLRHDLRDLPDGPLPPGARLRRGRRRDRTPVLTVDAAAFQPFWRFDQAGFEDARRATPSSRFRVVDAGAVVAYAITGRAGSVGYLQRLAVHPDHQRRGLGTALVADALRWARRHGSAWVLVNTQETNQDALALYLRLGFVQQPHGLAVLEHLLDGRGNGA